MYPVLLALAGGTLTFAATTAGSALVFCFRREVKPIVQTIFLGFAAGIMIAATVWSLLLPAMELAEEQPGPPWLPASLGFLLGGLVLLALDKLMPHTHPGTGVTEGIHARLGQRTMLVLAVTLHNIPEGFAVGLMFAGAAASGSSEVISIGSAMMLALGMCIQNLPEGAAVSLPLRDEGLTARQAFTYGTLSGIVEPIAAVVAALLVDYLTGAMPWLLSIAGGAMMYVVVEELIPEAHLGEHSHVGTFSVMGGFVLMMLLEGLAV